MVMLILVHIVVIIHWTRTAQTVLVTSHTIELVVLIRVCHASFMAHLRLCKHVFTKILERNMFISQFVLLDMRAEKIYFRLIIINYVVEYDWNDTVVIFDVIRFLFSETDASFDIYFFLR